MSNVSSIRNLVSKIIANQARNTQPAYASQISTVNSISLTSQFMNINPKIEDITVQTPTGPVTVPQPVINPIPINTPSSFISTNNNSVSVTSKGTDDTIITSVLDSIVNIEEVTNSGYTKNNSVLNLYDSISSNYWNPQVNEGNVNPYSYKLNYTFTGTNEIFKFVIKNNNTFPGFTNIRLYSTYDPLNYVDITPSTDTNNQYTNETIALLVDDNGDILFNTQYMTVEITLNPSVQPNTFYQYGQSYGVIYNTNTLGLRAGNYINTNTGASTGNPGSKLLWTTDYLLNQTTVTGTNNTDNNYLVSTDGQYRIAQNRTFYQFSNDGGITYTKKTLTTTSNMKTTPNGQFIIVNYNTTAYVSSNYGNSFNSYNISNPDANIYPYFSILYTGQYQMFVSEPSVGESNIIVYRNENYGIGGFALKYLQYSLPSTNYYIEIVNVIEKVDGTMLVVINTRYSTIEGVAYGVVIYGYLPAGSINPVLLKYEPFLSSAPTLLYALDQNYSNDSNEGQYKTGFGLYNYGGYYGEPCFFVTTNDSTYTIYNNSLLFPEYNIGIATPSLRLQIRNTNIKISNNGSNQIVIVQWYYINTPSLSDIVTSYYSLDSGSTWQKSNSYPSILNSFSNIVAANDFSIIQACGGYYYNYNGQYRTDPISYISTDYGQNWSLNSSINPASSIVSTNFYTINSITNKTYFQIKDLNQNQVLGVSDNGFNMTKDLRVNNKNAYVIGGTMTIGPDTASALLNDYSFNVDGTLSARNIVLLSDERFKNIISNQDVTDAFNKINKLNIIKYKFKDRPHDDRQFIGMIAQQVKEVIDDAVDINSSTYQNEEGNVYIDNVYSINYTAIMAYLISSYQYTNNKLDNIENIINYKLNN